MENRKLVKFLIPIFVLGFFVANFNSAFAYEIETHAYLTSEIVKFYNQNFPNNKIPEEFNNYLIDGSRREDDSPRWMNHFIDPVNNRGLTYDPAIDSLNLGNWQMSKDWAQDSNNQNQLTYKVPTTIASILTAIQQKTISVLTTETDFTWQKAIRFYVRGEKEKAMFILGHILHLMEDGSVPDHTRNDPHPGDSVYENYTQKFTLSNSDSDLSSGLSNKSPIILPDLNSYFDELARYSNNNFYSKETVGLQSGYKVPAPDFTNVKLINNLYYVINKDFEGNEYYLVAKKSLNNLILDSKYSFIIDEVLIKNSYWSRLSTKSVQYGAGVINLFFQEVEKAKNDPNFIKREEESFFGKIIGKIKNLTGQVVSTVGGFFSNLFGGDNQGFQPAGQVSLGQPDAVQSTPNKSLRDYTGQAGQAGIGSSTQASVQTPVQAPKKIQQPQIIEEDEELAEQQQAQKQIQQEQQEIIQQPEQVQLVAGKTCGFAMGSGKTPSHQGIIINEVAWMGTQNSANDEWIELKNISNGAIDINGWQIIDQGEQIKIQLGLINKTKLNPGEFILLERTDDDSVPNIAADLIYTGALSNTNEGLRLFNSQCDLIDEVLANSDWPAGDSAQKRSMERSSDFLWHTFNGTGQNNIFGTPKKENSTPTVATTGGSGGGSPSSTQQPTADNQQQTAKILINEIQIAGINTNDELIELYNPNNQDVDLQNWVLKKKTSSGSESNLVSSASFSGTIPALGYFLIVHQLKDDGTPNYQGQSSPDLYFSGKTYYIAADNTILLYDQNNNLIDKVGFGLAADCEKDCALNPDANYSIQRKFQNNTFIDNNNNASDFEIQTCPSPKVKTCSVANQPPSAFFVYTPQNPEIEQEIIFNAASSTDPDGNIILYQWDFGDAGNATSSQTTISHSYSSAGDYLVSLIVWDNQNASSTVVSASISVGPAVSAGVDHIIISEIYPDRTGENKDFIEFYNPTDSEVNVSNWSVQVLSANATSTDKIKKKNFENSNVVFPRGFFLVGIDDYEGGVDGYSSANMSWTSGSLNSTDGATVFLIDDTEEITGIADSNIVDRLAYGSGDGLILPEEFSVILPNEGQSVERRAWQNNSCVSAQNDGEFLGNGCDTDNNQSDFEIRPTPNPQNSQSLAEPRTISTSITEENWDISYEPETLSINFSWPENPNLTYEIMEYNSPGVSIYNGSANTFSKQINEVGRKYEFSIQVFDAEGAGSELIEKEIEAPSFIKNMAFYKASHRDFYGTNTEEPLIEFSYAQYPFLPRDLKLALAYGEPPGPNYKVVVFYPNTEAPKDEFLQGVNPRDENLDKVLKTKYNVYCGYNDFKFSLLLADIPGNCDAGGFRNGVLNFSQYLGENDNHLLFPVQKSDGSDNFSTDDYFTIAYYGFYRTYPQGSADWFAFDNFKLLAVDKNKYYFQNSPPAHQPPTAPSDFQTEFNGVDVLTVSFASSTDPDTLDSLINY